MHGLTTIGRLNRPAARMPEPEPAKPGADVWVCRFCGQGVKLMVSHLEYSRRGRAKAIKVPARCECPGAKMFYAVTDGLETN